MSTHDQQVHRDVASRDANQAQHFFSELLYENPEVCNQCYQKIRDHTEHNINRLGTGNRPTETLERARQGIVGYSKIDKDEYGEIYQTIPSTYCGECGRPNGRSDPKHIRSTQTLLGHADNIARRLHEHGYYPDLDVYYNTLTQLKSEPEYQGRDREIYTTAVWLACINGEWHPDTVDPRDFQDEDVE